MKKMIVGLISMILVSLSLASYAGEAVQIGSGPQLFVDDFLVKSQSGLKHVVNHPQKLPEPVITGKGDGCWRRALCRITATVHRL